MPLPIIIPIGMALTTALYGVGKGARSIARNKDAKDTNVQAQRITDNAAWELESARELSQESLERLGEMRLNVLDKSITRFVSVFEKTHDVELSDSSGLDELSKYRLDKQALSELKTREV